MSTPQLENGYTRVANEILEQLSRVHLSPNEWRVLMFVFRWSYGNSGRKQGTMSNGFIAKGTGLQRSNVIRTLKRLVQRQLVSVATLGGSKAVGFQKDFKKWHLVSAPTPSVSTDTTPKKSPPNQRPSVSTDTTQGTPDETPQEMAPNQQPSVGTDTQKRSTSRSKILKPIRLPPREAIDAAEVLADLILDHTPEHTQLNSDTKRTKTCNRWALDIEKLHRIDGLSWSQIQALIRWCQADQFWRSNILSGKKLREKANQCIARMRATGAATHFSAGKKLSQEQTEQLEQLIRIRENNDLDVTDLRARLDRARSDG
jgi:phage replication O-like protein O